MCEKRFDSLLDFQRAVDAVAFVRGSEKLYLITVTLIVNLAEDQLQKFPERLRLLQPLIACDVVVTPPKREEERVRRRFADPGDDQDSDPGHKGEDKHGQSCGVFRSYR